MSIATGQTSAEQISTREWSPFSGMAKTRRMEGTTAAALATQEALLQQSGWAYRVKDLGAKWEIEWTEQNTLLSIPGISNVTPLSDVWEQSTNIVEKDLLESDTALMNLLFTESGSQSQFDIHLKDLKELMGDPSRKPYPYAGGSSAEKLTRLITSGVRSTRIFQPTLRRVRVVTSNYNIKDSISSVGKIIRASLIQSREGVPATINFTLPSAYTATRTDSMGALLKYGWFKKPISVMQLADGQWQITLEYEWGLWHGGLYEFIT